MKKILSIFFLFAIIIVPNKIVAKDYYVAEAGGIKYTSIQNAIKYARSNSTIKILQDTYVTMKTGETYVTINKNLTFDLNGHNIISYTNKLFYIEKGNITFTGKGTLKANLKTHSAIAIAGSTNEEALDYTTVTIEKDVTVDAGYPVFITHNESKAHGVTLNIYGKIIAKEAGVYVNGNIKHKNNAPKINIYDGATISSEGLGIYGAGFASWIIKQAEIKSVEAGLGIKSGIFDIDGGVVSASGEDNTPAEAQGSGITGAGATIQIESNKGYAGGIILNIQNGTFISENGVTLYEYLDNSTEETALQSILINNGIFISGNEKEVFVISNSFRETHERFISGGLYKTKPEEQMIEIGKEAIWSNNYYEVGYKINKNIKNGSSAMSDVGNEGEEIVINNFIPKKDYVLKTISIVNNETKETIIYNKETSSFTMPKSSVTVNITYQKIPTYPKQLSAKLYKYNKIEASWSKEPGANGYYIYYKKGDKGKWTFLTNTTKTSIKTKALTSGTRYYIKIMPYVKDIYNKNRASHYKYKIVTTLKKINNLKVKKYNKNKVKLTYNKVDKISGYEISKIGNNQNRIIIATKNSIIISQTPKIKYTYKIRAFKTVNGKRVYAPWSNKVSFTIK